MGSGGGVIRYLTLLNYDDTIGPFTSATILTSHNSGATAGSALFGNYSLIDTPKLKRSQAASASKVRLPQYVSDCGCVNASAG
jgi:hypothetical protein